MDNWMDKWISMHVILIEIVNFLQKPLFPID